MAPTFAVTKGNNHNENNVCNVTRYDFALMKRAFQMFTTGFQDILII